MLSGPTKNLDHQINIFSPKNSDRDSSQPLDKENTNSRSVIPIDFIFINLPISQNATSSFITSVLQPPLTIPFLQLPFYHIPTCKLPLFNPLIQSTQMENQAPPFMYQHQILKDSQGWNVPDLNLSTQSPLSQNQDFLGSSPTQVVPASIPTTSQVRNISKTPLSPYLGRTQDLTVEVDEIEVAINMMREMRTKIGVLKELKIMIFKERFVKTHILICPSNLLKSSINIKTLSNPKVGSFVVVLNPTIMNLPRTPVRSSPIPPSHTLGPMNLIIWNCRGSNGVKFRRNFR